MEYKVEIKSNGDLKIIKTISLNKSKDLIEFFSYLIKTGKTDKYHDDHGYGYVPILGMYPSKYKFSLSWKYYDGKPYKFKQMKAKQILCVSKNPLLCFPIKLDGEAQK